MNASHPVDVAARRAEVDRRLGQVRELLDRREAAGALLRSRRDFAWLTAGGANHVVLESEHGLAAVLVTPSEARVVTSRIEAARIADEELAGLDLPVDTVPWEEPDSIERAAANAVDGMLLGDAELEDDLVPLRSVLPAFDRARLAWLGERGGRAIRVALDLAEPGQTEDEISSHAAALLGSEGIRTPVVLAAADDRIARYRHPLPSDTIVRRRVMLVLVAERWGLHVAVTRFREFEPMDEELAARIAATRDVQRRMHEATVPGATLGDVFAVAQQAYAAHGFPDEWRLHHQGGTIAYQGRERVATPGDPTRLEPGMAFAWNPSITGAKAEDTFILGEHGERRVVTTAADEPAD